MFTTKEYFFHLIIFPTIWNHKYSYENIYESFLALIALNINSENIWETYGEKVDFLHWYFSKLLKIGLESHLHKSRELGWNALFEGQQRRKHATVTQNFNKNMRNSLHENDNKN